MARRRSTSAPLFGAIGRSLRHRRVDPSNGAAQEGRGRCAERAAGGVAELERRG